MLLPARRGARVTGSAEQPPPPAPPPVVREGFEVGVPAAEGIDEAALARLSAKAKAQHSQALLVVKNGKLVREEYFGAADGPIFAMSARKVLHVARVWIPRGRGQAGLAGRARRDDHAWLPCRDPPRVRSVSTAMEADHRRTFPPPSALLTSLLATELNGACSRSEGRGTQA